MKITHRQTDRQTVNEEEYTPVYTIIFVPVDPRNNIVNLGY